MLERALRDEGLEAFLPAVSAQALPVAQLLLGAASSLELGESRIGGVPDLPVGMTWPRNADGEALSFLLQVRLEQLDGLEGNPFPAVGMLYFFVGLDEPASDVKHCVLLHSGNGSLERATRPESDEFAGDSYNDIWPHKLDIEISVDVPRWATSDHDVLSKDMTDDQMDEFNNLQIHASPATVIGQLLGHVCTIGQDTREDAFVVREVNPEFLYDYTQRDKLDMTQARRWRNLLRVDSVGAVDLTIWDAGFFNVLVLDADLEKLDFSKLYVAVETS